MTAATRTDTFPHAIAREALPPELVARTLTWMEEHAPWRLRVADFYEQWEMHLGADSVPGDLEDLIAPATVSYPADELLPTGRGSVRLVEVTAHRMTAGQTIRVHNDFRPEGETHRILVQLNRGWRDEQGGLLMLFGSGDAGDIRRVIRPSTARASALRSPADRSMRSPPSRRASASRSFTRSARKRAISGTHSPPWLFDRVPPLDEVTSEMRLRTLLPDVPRGALDALNEEGLATMPCDGLKSRLDPVDDLLAVAPDLVAIVHATVGAIHPLAAQPGYDVSHSQPRWRDRIFVSFPDRTDEIGALRLAESVVHEAMHLHLTNKEVRTPLVAAMYRTTHSPWRGTVRAVQGVLHGVFVFSCIHCLLSTISKRVSLGEGERRYVSGRLKNIEREMDEVDLAALEAALTLEGALYLRSWHLDERVEARC